jgi:hypothetical protein
MILILSEEADRPTVEVVRHLERLGADFCVITGVDVLNRRIGLEVGKNTVSIDGVILENISIVWYRRWLSKSFIFSNDVVEHVYLSNEFREFSKHIFLSLSPSKGWLNKPPHIKPPPSKAEQLRMVRDYGLATPRTLITNSRERLRVFYQEESGKIIAKNLSDPLVYTENGALHATYTTRVDQSDIDEQTELMSPSKFQNEINKLFEVRSFFFNDKFYSYAIFSQRNSQTQVDYRVYDHSNPNRIMAFQLPEEVKRCLSKLLLNLGLDTASIDLIFDGENYIFLEINSQGMFGGMQRYGLEIESDIANYLYEKNNL